MSYEGAQRSDIVVECYNDAKDFRIIVYRRRESTFGYYFERLHQGPGLEGVPPEVDSYWTEDNPHASSGAYDSAQAAMGEAKRELGWVARDD